jgi:hypothetical protein
MVESFHRQGFAYFVVEKERKKEASETEKQLCAN